MPTSATFGFDPVAGAAGMAAFALVDEQHEVTALSGTNLQMGLMTLLFDAELLAAQAGLVPWVQLDDGSRGVFTIGAARDVLDRADPGLRTLYLAAHGVARRATNESKDVTRSGGTGSLQLLMSHEENMGALPVLPLVVLGVAAIVASAWFAASVGEKLVQTRSTELKYAAKIDALLKLAQPVAATGQQLPPGFWEAFGDMSEREAKAPYMPYLVGGGLLAAAAGVYWVWTSGGPKRVRS